MGLGYHFPDKPIHVRCVYNVFTSGWASSAISMGSAVLGEVRTLIFQRCHMELGSRAAHISKLYWQSTMHGFSQKFWEWPPPHSIESGSAHCDLALAVSGCTLWDLAVAWGPAVPTEIWRSRLRPGSAHWDLELVVEGGAEDEEVKEEEEEEAMGGMQLW